MYFFRTFKKSTTPYKVHNMGLRYIKLPMYSFLYGAFGMILMRANPLLWPFEGVGPENRDFIGL